MSVRHTQAGSETARAPQAEPRATGWAEFYLYAAMIRQRRRQREAVEAYDRAARAAAQGQRRDALTPREQEAQDDAIWAGLRDEWRDDVTLHLFASEEGR